MCIRSFVINIVCYYSVWICLFLVLKGYDRLKKYNNKNNCGALFKKNARTCRLAFLLAHFVKKVIHGVSCKSGQYQLA